MQCGGVDPIMTRKRVSSANKPQGWSHEGALIAMKVTSRHIFSYYQTSAVDAAVSLTYSQNEIPPEIWPLLTQHHFIGFPLSIEEQEDDFADYLLYSSS
ncbi:hypothetical protein J5N97_027016 [Dioscorea zingiberensis]|uniref:Uncharacterized protein n=1 Tax=Dioscorea zingiberensis TaxID=325984 RepID=A0A9D5C466_9LILI|nr:hypothetical protein J5N97_027016 [Dioscorea zingiberensis]